MQRKATKNTRGANAAEKAFHAFTKESDCGACGNAGPSIVHHCMGATYKHNKVLIGHWFVLPLCKSCDDIITHGSRRKFKDEVDLQSHLWAYHASDYKLEKEKRIPEDVFEAIIDSNE